AAHRDLLSFPTRRSSDLRAEGRLYSLLPWFSWSTNHNRYWANDSVSRLGGCSALSGGAVSISPADAAPLMARVSFSMVGDSNSRSEEHTSELQSRENLVC